jgi:hypothetical protein
MFVHPFMPDLKSKSLDDIVKEMNDIYVKMKGVNNGQLLLQMQMVLEGYREEYTKRMSEDMEKKTKNKGKKTDGRSNVE